MTDIQRAKLMLQQMPDEVFDIWIAPLIRSNGWPFSSPDSINLTGPWSQYFRRRTVKQIGQMVWDRRNILTDARVFQPNTQQILRLVIQAYVHGSKTAFAKVGKVKGGQGGVSFFRSRAFIERTGRLHTDVVLWHYADGLQIADGVHRIAALFSIVKRPRVFTAWVAKA